MIGQPVYMYRAVQIFTPLKRKRVSTCGIQESASALGSPSAAAYPTTTDTTFQRGLKRNARPPAASAGLIDMATARQAVLGAELLQHPTPANLVLQRMHQIHIYTAVLQDTYVLQETCVNAVEFMVPYQNPRCCVDVEVAAKGLTSSSPEDHHNPAAAPSAQRSPRAPAPAAPQ